MTYPPKTDHDMLVRIAALLRVVAVLLPAHRAALTLLDVPLDGPDLSSSACVPVPSRMDDRTCQRLLLQLSVSFRLIAAVLLHACLAESRPRAMRHAGARVRAASDCRAPRHLLRGIGFHDTS